MGRRDALVKWLFATTALVMVALQFLAFYIPSKPLRIVTLVLLCADGIGYVVWCFVDLKKAGNPNDPPPPNPLKGA